MGEVWKARDTRLDRSVAIKVLPPEFANNAQLKMRFEREAKTISQLSHPHICTLYDVGRDNGTDYLVMELIEGESLADRLTRGPLPIEEVFRYGIEIAEGLDKAHRQGIVHRDLKPANIMLTKSGAKLLDFGLAKTATGVLTPNDATMQKSLTTEGTIVGTFQYMSPEQLEGIEADVRTDIFALGAVLYEMASGRRAFEGKTRTSLIASIVSSQPPPISHLQPMTPPAFEHVVQRCLEKDPADRWQSARDIAEELKWIRRAGSQAGIAIPVTSRRRSRERFAWILAGLLLAASAIFASLWWRATKEPPRRVEMSILPPEKTSFGFENGGAATLSPDGRRLVFVARTADGATRLWVRSLDRASAQELAGTEGATYPFWSPDGRFIAFFTATKLKKIDAGGGPPQTITDLFGNGRPGAWNREGTILFSPSDRDSLFRVSSSGGKSVPITELAKGEYSHRWVRFLPDGQHFIYTAQSTTGAERGAIWVGKLGSAERKLLVAANSPAWYSAAGYLLFCRERTLLAQRFDVRRQELVDEPISIAEKVRSFPNTGFSIFSVSENGTLAYQSGAEGSNSQLTWVDRSGKPLGVVGAAGEYLQPRISHDGRRVAVALIDPQNGRPDVWILDTVRNTPTRFTFEPGAETTPVWSPDDREIMYVGENEQGDRIGVAKSSTGAGPGRVVFTAKGSGSAGFTDWARDGKTAIVQWIPYKSRSGWDLSVVTLQTGAATPFANTRFYEMVGVLSPDGRWIAYQSNESGRMEVYVEPYPNHGGRWQVSTSGGSVPRWNPLGGELLYLSPDGKLMTVSIDTRNAFEAGVPAPLFSANLRVGASSWDIAPDGKRFLLNSSVGQEAPSPLTVVLNWPAELEK